MIKRQFTPEFVNASDIWVHVEDTSSHNRSFYEVRYSADLGFCVRYSGYLREKLKEFIRTPLEDGRMWAKGIRYETFKCFQPYPKEKDRPFIRLAMIIPQLTRLGLSGDIKNLLVDFDI